MARKSMLKPARASRFQNFPNRRYRLLTRTAQQNRLCNRSFADLKMGRACESLVVAGHARPF
jgi:hypothetical protein